MMVYSVKYSRKTVEDLQKIKEDVFKACLDKNITVNYLKELMDKIKEKELFPESGTPLMLMGMFTGYRFIVYKAYIAFYRIESKEILIDRILLGKSDYINILNL